ncbi:PKD domain-containing protein, partial [Reichenbachiella agariperforans]|uniref:PKD domain-containing protein n=1 Tax=Reichenbachiella agariperforans TaxID=156994 RepID=UPI001C0A24CA
TYNITLYAQNEEGTVNSSTQSITVSSSTAPNIDFTVDDSRCIDNTNTFTAIVEDPAAISSYAWDFGDESAIITDANTTHQYSTAGTYTVTLSVESSEGCTNTSTQEITVYNAPSDPEFSYSATTLCSNSEISFSNLTEENGSAEAISYTWDFNGEATSTDKDPVYAFASAGSKTVSMTAMIPGCSITHSEIIEITEGPNASFSYTNNCFGEAILFSNTSTGTAINGYTWDFGDGSASLTDENPSHQYSTAGDYTVNLSVSNSSGCETATAQIISVSDADKVDFSYGETIENLPVDFMGEDLTLDDDAISSWSWDFGGLGSATEQNASFTFSTAGEHEVTLTVNSSQGCEETTTKTLTISQAQCPTPNFSIPSSVCIGENISITNSSVNADSFQWDFCSGTAENLTLVESIATINELSNSFGLATVND